MVGWTEQEASAVVEGYFNIWRSNEGANKLELFRELHESAIPDRSARAIAMKFQNVSAVLRDLDLPFIKGLGPLDADLELLRELVEARLAGRRAENWRRFQDQHPAPDHNWKSITWRDKMLGLLGSVFGEEVGVLQCYATASDPSKQAPRQLGQAQHGGAQFLMLSYPGGLEDHDTAVEILKRPTNWTSGLSGVAVTYWDGSTWILGTLVHRPKSRFVGLVRQLLNDAVQTVEVDAEPERRRLATSAFSLNTIIYGPPGTGKTWSTKRRAVAMCGGDTSTDDAVAKSYRSLVDTGRIRFVTFHQSFAYEDFVEGIRPSIVPETGAISYEPEDGVFKRICATALAAMGKANTEIIGKEAKIWKMSLGDTGIGESETVYNPCLADGCIRLGYGLGLDFNGADDRAAVLAKHREVEPATKKLDYSVTSVNTFKNVMRPDDIVVVSDGNQRFRAIARITGEYEFDDTGWAQKRDVEWLATYETSLSADVLFKRSISQMTLYELRDASIKRDVLESLISGSKERSHEPCVLIIDEINRANTSKVFGELITLLERSKRLGAADERRVTLPYSRELFGVPPNLFVIGTMNTADRSIAFLDLALRRRFDFEETPPDLSGLRDRVGPLEGGIDVAELLNAINNRIRFLLDRDHEIGHSFFWDVEDLDDLARVFHSNVIPLLREYFYEDWAKVARVLGCGYGENGGCVDNDSPLVVALQVSATAVFGEVGKEYEDLLDVDVSPFFKQASGAALIPFFQGILVRADG